MKFHHFVIFLTILPALLSRATPREPPVDIFQEEFSKARIIKRGDFAYAEAYVKYLLENKYVKALNLSLLFIEAQRSGKLPADNKIPWRGDSALLDRGNFGEDLTGGYYDGTTHVKFIWPMAFTTTLLAWGSITWVHSYNAAGQLDKVRKAIKWATDYFIKCHIRKNALYYQVGDYRVENQYWGRPEDMDEEYRPAYLLSESNPASDVAAEVAAALAAASIVFKHLDNPYSAKCLQHAKELYKFATDYPSTLFNDKRRGPWDLYEGQSDSYEDELIWAAIWIYKASQEIEYFNNATNLHNTYFGHFDPNKRFYFNEKNLGNMILLAEASFKKPKEMINLIGRLMQELRFNVKYTEKTLLYIPRADVSRLPYAANMAFIYMQLASMLLHAKSADYGNLYLYFVDQAEAQIDYILGSKGTTFVVGYDEKSPTHPYHRASSCPDRPNVCGWEYYNSSDPNPQILYGALVAGPDRNDVFDDSRTNIMQTKVALVFNAGFTGALAGLLSIDLNRWMKSHEWMKQ